MCGARAVLAHFNTVLAVVGGAALVVCGLIMPGEVAARVQAVPSAGALLKLPFVAGPLLLAFAHLGVSALHAAPATARVLLAVYSASCALAALAAAGVLGWAAYQITAWLRDDELALQTVSNDTELRAWLRPLMPLVEDDKNELMAEESISAEMVVALSVAALTLLLLLASAALALAARPRRLRDDEHALRRCSSVYYEPSAPAYKTPLDDPAAWH